ncbi:MAG: Gfo/Idh/MocA family oxidoreductase [Oscillospiraceae bacterium]|nr:Gfo/Idh/MocA family oxidoreductase [Oscillospiraceae bacterium]
MAKLKIGIVGCGNIANTKHLPNLAKFSDRVEIVAFCDIVEEKAVKAKEKYGTPDAKVFTDYKELIKEDLDAVHVCTPNRSHSEISVAAMEAGNNVMCEKPMAINSAEALAMVEASERTGKLLTIGYQNRFRVDTQTLKKMAVGGELGDIYMAKAHALRRRGIPTWGVFTNKYEQGGGPLIDIGTHSLDITLWIMDNYKPVAVSGSTYNTLGTTLAGDEQGTEDHWDPKTYEVEDAAFGFVKFENGATVFLESSWALNTTDERQAMTTVYGTKAGAAMEFPMGAKGTDRVLRVNTVVNGRQTIIEPNVSEGKVSSSDLIFNYPGAEKEQETWLNALEGKGELVVKPRQAYTVTRILEAIYEAANTGKTVYFND